MKKIINIINITNIIGVLLLTAISTFAQPVYLLNKGDTFIDPKQDVIIINKQTFGKYQYTVEKYDTLKKEIEELDSVYSAHEISYQNTISGYEALVKEKEKEIDVIKNGYNDVRYNLEQSIDKNNKLYVDYLSVVEKHKRAKRWRNVFMGTTGIFIGVLIIAIL